MGGFRFGSLLNRPPLKKTYPLVDVCVFFRIDLIRKLDGLFVRRRMPSCSGVPGSDQTQDLIGGSGTTFGRHAPTL